MSPQLCLQFLKFLQEQFDIEDMGMAHWYLQGRLTQNEDYSVVLDQSQYMELSSSRFLPQHDNINVTKEDKAKPKSPLPATSVPTNKDCAANLLEVQMLEDTYGFQYSSVIGMLILFLKYCYKSTVHNQETCMIQFITMKAAFQGTNQLITSCENIQT